MDYEKLKGSIWFNGKLVSARSAKLHILSHGLHFASVSFEGIRVYNGEPFLLSDHIKRLFDSSKMLEIKIKYTRNQIANACKKIIKIQKLKEGYLRPVVWRGGQSMAPGIKNAKINLAIAGWEWPVYYSNLAKEKGIKLTTTKWKRPPIECAPVKSKCSGLYMICTLAKHEAEKKKYDDAIMQDLDGNVCETTSSNIFFIKNGKIETPIADCFLSGITRKTVIKICKRQNLNIKETKINFKKLKSYESCFITGTAAEITPVNKINKIKYDTNNNILKKIMNNFEKLKKQNK